MEQYEGIIAACLAIAYEELSQQEVSTVDANGQLATEVCRAPPTSSLFCSSLVLALGGRVQESSR